MKKNEIDLNLIPLSGEKFTYDAQDLGLIRGLESTIIQGKDNQVAVKIKPIDGPHYQLNISYSLQCERDCSRCGKTFEKLIQGKHEDFLSTQMKEGEDEGFIIVEKPNRWDWAEYLRQTIELEIPYQDLCKSDCKPTDERVILAGKKAAVHSPFEKLKDLKTLKKH